MKKLSSLVLFVALTGAFVLLGAPKASAATLNANNIIDNGIFDNSESMSASQINAFLNSLPGSCISPNSGFDAIDPTGYSPSTGFTFGGWTTAGQVIFDAAQAYDLNPQVLLATLQKEQSLVSGNTSICSAGSQNQYAAALGYDCPDSGTTYSYSNVNLYERNGVMVSSTSSTCVDKASAAGFSQQLIRAAWLLKFGEQRSQGNIGWAVINGNWDNSDDPQSCYDGPMTQGTFLICPNGPSTYYDGYTTIDGSSVYMTNGATASLYWYTPHLSGNENFFNIFSAWFGSTTYSQPIDSMFVVGNQSGKAYFISLNSDTYYFIPNWSTVQAFGLDNYQVMPMDDSQIDSYTNGGTLTTLVWNNDDQKIYLVDHDTKYWFQSYCAQWGLDCLNQTPGDVTFMTSTYFDDIVGNGGSSQPIQQDNGSLYLMQNGTKEPFANTASLLAAGYNGSEILPIDQSDLNSTQPLGSLQISTPGFLEFPPSTELLYFDGTSYHYVPAYSVYQSWGGPPISVPVTSAYNTTLPTLSGSNLSDWVQDGSNYYFMDSGNKIDITSTYSNWTSSGFINLPDEDVSSAPTLASQPFINVNGAIYAVQGGGIRHIPTYEDYLWLGINGNNTLNLSTAALSSLTEGPDIMRDGAAFTITNNPGLYVTYGSSSYHIPSATMANDFGVDWNSIRSNLNPNVLSTGYPSLGDLTRWVRPNGGSLDYVANRNLITISAAAAANWGINLNTASDSNVGLGLLYGTDSTTALGNFVCDETTGRVYYASGGTYHYIASWSTFVALGGRTPVLNVYPDFFTGLTQGSTYN